MKLDFKQAIKSLKGDSIQLVIGDEKQGDMTIGWACNEALLAHNPKEEVGAADKMKRFVLAHRIVNAEGPIDVTAEDAALLKKLVALHLSVLVAAQVMLAVEGKTLDKNGKEIPISESGWGRTVGKGEVGVADDNEQCVEAVV